MTSGRPSSKGKASVIWTGLANNTDSRFFLMIDKRRSRSDGREFIMDNTDKTGWDCIQFPEEVKTNILETMDYQYRSKRDIAITIRQPEYTSVCPMTGLPDTGCITIRYCPGDRILELKSLKYYLLQYRNVGIFYEHVVNRILEDLVGVLNPKWLEVTGDFTARGGITTNVAATYKEK